MQTERRNARTYSMPAVLGALMLLHSAVFAAESGEVTLEDRDFMRVERMRLRGSHEYRRAMRDVQKLEATIADERKEPYDAKRHRLQLRDPALPLTVNPAIRRALQPSVAIIVFDVTGSGRVVGPELISAGPHPQWGEDAMEMVADWLFEPLVEGDVGVKRVGITAALYAELDGGGKACGLLMSAITVDFEQRACVKVKPRP